MACTRRATTLIELILALASTAVLMCLVLPVLAQSRGHELRLRSTANLRLHGQMLAMYAGEHRNEVLNPYGGLGRFPYDTYDIYPPWACGHAFSIKWDAYAYHWGSLARQYYADYEQIDVFAAPGDQETYEALLECGDHPFWVMDISYWYSPTMFYRPGRFRSADGGDTSSGATPWNLRRNRLDDMTFPSRKVVVFEKQDFATPEKLLFAHPDANVGLLLGDGSVRVSDNQPLYQMIYADPDLAPSGGNWADQAGLRRYYMDNAQSPDELLEDQQYLYPAFYIWTRRGIQGRDLF
ncbi:MAG: hypothetical protein KAS72_07120 [Phycisphaerales bacterium]|nr:hypothetical protein [Phycisphaerales bacterium]